MLRRDQIDLAIQPERAANDTIRNVRARVKALLLELADCPDTAHREATLGLGRDFLTRAERMLTAHGGEIGTGAAEADPEVIAALEKLTKKQLGEHFAGLNKPEQVAALATVSEELSLDEE